MAMQQPERLFAEIAGRKIEVVSINQRPETLDIMSLSDPIWPVAVRYSDIDFVAMFDSELPTFLASLIGRRVPVTCYDGNELSLVPPTECIVATMNMNHGQDGTIAFSVRLGRPVEINSPWWIDATDEQRHDVAYLGIAADWHFERDQVELGEQFVQRVRSLRGLKR